MISNTNKINPNEAKGKIGITPTAAKIIQTFLWTISIFSEKKSSINKTAEISITKGNSNRMISNDQKLKFPSIKVAGV
jgi:hypothetical protein